MKQSEMPKQLIIQLLVQDMRHEQLIDGLGKLGFVSDLHSLAISGVVAELMGIPKMDISSDWFDIYMDFLGRASQYEITGNGKNLLPLAETCYTFLTLSIEREKKCKQKRKE